MRLLHLSDIHFEAVDNAIATRNRAMRDRILVDIRDQVGDDGIDLIVITGDVAFSGSEAEYAAVVDWISEVQQISRCDEVLIVPGNHDVDRSAHARSAGLRTSVRTLKQADPYDVEYVLSELLDDEYSSAHVARPFEHFNEFAARYRCQMETPDPQWSRDFPLGNGFILRVHGMYSVFACDKSDRRGEVVLGHFQCMFEPLDEHYVHLTLCHHPPDWLMDQDIVEPPLINRASVQLFGHKHQNRILRIEDSLRIVAGAAFPEERSLNWEPGYNILSVQVDGSGHSARELVVTSNQRVWNEAEQEFATYPSARNLNANGFRVDRLPIGRRQVVGVAGVDAEDAGEADIIQPVEGGRRSSPGALLRRLPELAQLSWLTANGLLLRSDSTHGSGALNVALARIQDADAPSLIDSLKRFIDLLNGDDGD